MATGTRRRPFRRRWTRPLVWATTDDLSHPGRTTRRRPPDDFASAELVEESSEWWTAGVRPPNRHRDVDLLSTTKRRSSTDRVEPRLLWTTA